MRKKNVPKSSNDVTDSNDPSNSEDEIPSNSDSPGQSSESEEDIRVTRKRPVAAKKASDEDEDYEEP